MLAGLLVLGFLLGQLQSSYRRAGRPDVVTSLVTRIESPLTGFFASTTTASSKFWNGVLHASALVDRNQKLEALARSAELYNARVDLLTQEIDNLRKLQNFAEIPGKIRIGGMVVGYFPTESRATLNIGTSSGVAAGCPVICGEGLLGVVQTADRNSCLVTLLWSSAPDFKGVGGLILSNPPSASIVHGEGVSRLRMDIDPNSNVKAGDKVVTTGYSERIPRGIPIGQVVEVVDDRDFGVKRVQVYPEADISTVREVVVLK